MKQLHFLRILAALILLAVLPIQNNVKAQGPTPPPDTIRTYIKYLGSAFNTGKLADTIQVQNWITNALSSYSTDNIYTDNGILAANRVIGLNAKDLTFDGISDVVIKHSGDVGVGTSIPSAKLDVVGNTEINGILDVVSAGINLSGTAKYNSFYRSASSGASYGFVLGYDSAINGGIIAPFGQGYNRSMSVWGLNSSAWFEHTRFNFDGSLTIGEYGVGAFSANDGTILGVEADGSLYETNIFSDGGRVGIGTTSTSSKLEINGDLAFRSDGGTPGSNTRAFIEGFYDSGGSGYGGGLKFYTRTTQNIKTERMSINNTGGIRFNSMGNGSYGATTSRAAGLDISNGNLVDNTNVWYKSGNVGIGVSAPDQQLTIKSGSSIGWEYTAGHGTSTHTISAGLLDPIKMKVAAFSANTPIFQVEGNTSAKRLTVLNGGNVGIGTSIPDLKFSVSNTTAGNISQAIFGQDKTEGESYIVLGEAALVDKAFFMGYDHDLNYGGFVIGGEALGASLNIANGGNVGIGTSTPTSKLSVKSSGISSFVFDVLESTSSNRLFAVYETGAGDAIMALNTTSEVQAIKFLANGVSYFNGGNLAIGKTTASEKLDVAGNIKASGTITGSAFYGDGSNLTGIVASDDQTIDVHTHTSAGINLSLEGDSEATKTIPILSTTANNSLSFNSNGVYLNNTFGTSVNGAGTIGTLTLPQGQGTLDFLVNPSYVVSQLPLTVTKSEENDNRIIPIQIAGRSTEIEVAEGESYFIVPPEMDGYTCTSVEYKADSGTGSFTLHVRDTDISKSSTTVSNTTATTWDITDFVINTKDIIDFNISAVATSGIKGLSATISCDNL